MLRQTGSIRRFQFEGDFFTAPCCEITVDDKPIRYVESNRMAYKRVQSLFSKEPTTIPWLEAMAPNEVLVDIGANVGMYSIYAAMHSRCRVYAFEPESLNYAELNKNIYVNALHDRVSAYCLAMSDRSEIGYLNLGAFGIAYSHHDFNENSWTEDKKFGDKITRKEERLRQGCISATLDSLIEQGVLPTPDHVKIDVDGLEHRVVAGCLKTFANPQVQSVLIEIDHRIEKCRDLIDLMENLGWRYSMDQLRTNRKVIFTEETVRKFRREGIGGLNYIFFRDDRLARLFHEFLLDYTPPMSSPR
jgi:FkbM family methyltransferase